MISVKSSVALLAILAAAAASAVEAPVDAGSIKRQVDGLLSPWDRPDSPGLAVLVQRQGEDIYQSCVGMADLEQGVAIDRETCFDLASVSKHMTAFAALLLVEEGRLGLDDDIRRYLPELPAFTERIRVRDLIHQSSGLWEFWTILTEFSGFHARDYITMADVLALLAWQPAPVFEPGSRYAYTNTNYSLLSMIVERIAGRGYGDWTREQLFRPLGMEATHFQTDCTRLIPHKATAYLKQGGGYVLARPSNVEVPGSAHAFTTLRDMSPWLANLRSHRLGGAALFRRLTEPGVLGDGTRMSYAAGLIVRQDEGVTVIEHSGQTGGFKTMLIYCLEPELGIVVLANERSINAERMAHEILDICLARTEAPPPVPAAATNQKQETPVFTLSPDRMDVYTGCYRLDDGGRFLCFHRDREYLVAELQGVGREYLNASAPHRFRDFSGQTQVDFLVGADGLVTGVKVTRGNEVTNARPIAVARDAAAYLTEASGFYYCPPLDCGCQVTRGGSGMVLRHRRYGDMPLTTVDTDWCACDWGFIHFLRDKSDTATGFQLVGEQFGYQALVFARVGTEGRASR